MSLSSGPAGVRRGDALLDRLVRDRVLTSTGKEWLKVALDPFHDTATDPKGYPDTNIGASVLQVVKQTVNVSAPTGVTGEWDCNIFSLPILNNTPTVNLTNPNSNVVFPANSTASVTLGAINLTSAATSTSLTNLDISNGVTPLVALDQWSAGVTRVVAAGFEVVNTTADIYKQGQCIVYRQPQPTEQDVTYQISTGTGTPGILGAGSLRELNNPPASPQEAMLLSGTRQWAAEEGCYIPLVFNSPDLPAEADGTTGVIFSNPIPGGGGGASSYIGSQVNVDGTTGNHYFSSPTKFAQQHTGGAIFTGLSNQTTLQVTANFYLERFPNSNVLGGAQDLVVLAKKSPCYDIVAQELYSECIADMPVGVMVKENGLGDWFKEAVQKVTSVAAPILGMIPHPAAQAGAMLAQTANQIAGGKNVKRAQKAQNAIDTNNLALAPTMRRALKQQKRKQKRAAKRAMASG